jgi:hypothetical protein
MVKEKLLKMSDFKSFESKKVHRQWNTEEEN